MERAQSRRWPSGGARVRPTGHGARAASAIAALLAGIRLACRHAMSSSPPGAPHSLASSAAGVWRVSTHRPSAMATRQASHSAAMVRTPSGASVARLRGVVVPVMVTDPVAQAPAKRSTPRSHAA
ncbi:hypothetical protein G6F24_017056 [Rhizopus arrhizus]|nr:hypothetical protein G6F24_017056 [Rhizopus arrhizus]